MARSQLRTNSFVVTDSQSTKQLQSFLPKIESNSFRRDSSAEWLQQTPEKVEIGQMFRNLLPSSP